MLSCKTCDCPIKVKVLHPKMRLKNCHWSDRKFIDLHNILISCFDCNNFHKFRCLVRPAFFPKYWPYCSQQNIPCDNGSTLFCYLALEINVEVIHLILISDVLKSRKSLHCFYFSVCVYLRWLSASSDGG